jgi:hypothetical protein
MVHTRFGSKIIDSGGGSKIMVWGQKSSIPEPSKKGSKFDDFPDGGQKLIKLWRGPKKMVKKGVKNRFYLSCVKDQQQAIPYIQRGRNRVLPSAGSWCQKT